MSRLEAEKRLRWQDTGVFLMRESESAPGEFSVSVRSVNAPQQQITKRKVLMSDWRPFDIYYHVGMETCCKECTLTHYICTCWINQSMATLASALMHVFVRACVCERERERETESEDLDFRCEVGWGGKSIIGVLHNTTLIKLR